MVAGAAPSTSNALLPVRILTLGVSHLFFGSSHIRMAYPSLRGAMSVGFAVPRAVAGQSLHLAKTASRRSAANLKLPSYGVRGEEGGRHAARVHPGHQRRFFDPIIPACDRSLVHHAAARELPPGIAALLDSTVDLAKSRLFLTPTCHGSLRFAEGVVAILPADRRQAPADMIAGLTHSFRSKWLGRVDALRRALVPTLPGTEKTYELKDVKSVSSLIQTSIPKMGSRLAQSLGD